MNTLLKQKISNIKTAAQDNEYAISLIKEKIVMQQKYIDDLSKNTQDKIQENLDTIENNKKQIYTIERENEAHRTKISNLCEKLTPKTELLKQIENIKIIKTKLDEIGFQIEYYNIILNHFDNNNYNDSDLFKYFISIYPNYPKLNKFNKSL